MTVFREIRLGAEAKDYVSNRLALGKSLSKLLLQVVDLEAGRIVTTLPSDVDEKTAKDFETGGKLPSLVAEPARLEPVPNTDSHLAKEIKDFLCEAPSNLCILEDASASSSDPFLQSLDTQFSILGDEVYHLLCSNMDIDDAKILKTIRRARSWLFIGVMTSSPQDIDLCSERNALTSSLLNALAQRTRKIIVGAYDGEGYLTWTKT